MRITKNTLLTTFILSSVTGAISIAVPNHGQRLSVSKRQADFTPESDVDGQATGKLRGCREPNPFYKKQDAATWWERNDAKTGLENTRTSEKDGDPEAPKHDDQGRWVVDHILELQVVVDAFKDDNKNLNDKSKAISDKAWKKAQDAVNGDDKDGCKKVAEQVTVLDNLLGITNQVNLGKMAAVTKVLNKNTDDGYAKKWKDWIGAIVDELDNHSAGVGDVITKIGAALSDISGEDAVGGYISDFCTNNMQAVQTFLKEQQDDDSNSASTTTDPNAKPSPPVGTASPAQTNPTCNYNSVDQFSIGDVQDAHNFLAQEGYGNNNDNCCTGDKGACGQLAVSGGVTIQMCGPPSSGVQCAACANIAIALNVLNVDCQKDYKMGGTEGIPYLDGVTLELAAPVVT